VAAALRVPPARSQEVCKLASSGGTVQATQAEKCLTFTLADEVYGIGILKVQEIIGIMPVTRVPRTPAFVRGVINLRGKVIPVVDLRLKFGLATTPDTERTCIIVVQVAGEGRQMTTGVLVDEVSEVMDIPGDRIEPTPDFGAGVDTAYLKGIGKIDRQVILLLDIDAVLSDDQIVLLQDVAAQEQVDGEPADSGPVPPVTTRRQTKRGGKA